MSGPTHYKTMERNRVEADYFRMRGKGWTGASLARFLQLTPYMQTELEAAFRSASRERRGDEPFNKDPEHVAAVWEANPRGFVGPWSFEEGGAGVKSGPIVVSGPAYTRSAL